MCFHASSQALRSHTKPQYSLRKTDDCHFHTGKRAERQKWNQIKKKFTRYFYLLDVSRPRLLPLCTVLFGGVCAGLPGVCVCLWELILGVSICSLSSKRWTSHSCLLGLPASSRSPSSSPPCRDTHWLTHTSEFLSNNQCFFLFLFHTEASGQVKTENTTAYNRLSRKSYYVNRLLLLLFWYLHPADRSTSLF